MEGESGVTTSIIDVARSIIDELHSYDIQGDQNESESNVNQSVIDDFNFSDIQGDQMEGESCVTRGIINQLHSANMGKWKVKVALLGVSLVNFILGISKEIKWKVKMVLLELSLINFIL